MPHGIQRSVPLLAAAILGACDKGSQEPRVATTLFVAPAAQTMSEAGVRKFTATLLDKESQPVVGGTVTWQSDHPELVSIDSTGLATATASFLHIPGSSVPPVTITATAGALSGSASVTLVREGTFDAWPDTNVLFTGMTRAVTPSMIKTLSISYDPGGWTGVAVEPTLVQWSTSDAGVVNVNASGVMSAVGVGHARVIAAYLNRKDTVEVFVAAPPATPLRFTAIASGLLKVGRYGMNDAFGPRGCGVATDGDIYCWGATLDSTQVTDRCATGTGGVSGTKIFRYRCSEVPTRIKSDVKFTGVVVGGTFACGLATTKRAYCWGTNANGELGAGAIDSAWHDAAPIAGTDEFTELHGSTTLCGIRTDGTLRCWGGAFGASPITVGSGKTWRTVAEAGYCGLASDSTAFCFSGTNAQSVGGTTRWKSLATATVGVVRCAIGLDDAVYCGSNLETKQTTPESITRVVTYASSMAFGFDTNVCGLTAGGDLRCPSAWGLLSVPVKLRSVFGICAIGLDDKVYCRKLNSSTFALIPGQ